MVVKTQTCAWSENRIYPGKGCTLMTKDGKMIILSSKKCKAFYKRKTKGQVIRWTIIWRRQNKKYQTDKGTK